MSVRVCEHYYSQRHAVIKLRHSQMISGSFHTYNLPWMDVETSLNISFLIWWYWCTSAQKTILLWSICNVFSIRTCYHIHILESPINCMSCWEETRICEGNLTSHHTVRRVLYSYSEDCVAAVNTQTLEPTITQNPDSFKCVCVCLHCYHANTSQLILAAQCESPAFLQQMMASPASQHTLTYLHY